MTARNHIKFAAGQAHRAEILSILERYGWREPFAVLPAAKVVQAQMQSVPPISLRSVQAHVQALHCIERDRLRMRNLSTEQCSIPSTDG
jgi:hypothetical protein